MTTLAEPRNVVEALPHCNETAASSGVSLAQANDDSDYTIIRQGFLWKRGHVVKNWKRRYFVLQWSCNRGYMLIYSRQANKSKECRGEIHIGRKVTVSEADLRPFCFKIIEVGTNYSGLFLGASSENEKIAWIKDIHVCMYDANCIASSDLYGKNKQILRSPTSSHYRPSETLVQPSGISSVCTESSNNTTELSAVYLRVMYGEHMHISATSEPVVRVVVGTRCYRTRIANIDETQTMWQQTIGPIYVGESDRYALVDVMDEDIQQNHPKVEFLGRAVVPMGLAWDTSPSQWFILCGRTLQEHQRIGSCGKILLQLWSVGQIPASLHRSFLAFASSPYLRRGLLDTFHSVASLENKTQSSGNADMTKADWLAPVLSNGMLHHERVEDACGVVLHPFSDPHAGVFPGTLFITNYRLVFIPATFTRRTALGIDQIQHISGRDRGSSQHSVNGHGQISLSSDFRKASSLRTMQSFLTDHLDQRTFSDQFDMGKSSSVKQDPPMQMKPGLHSQQLDTDSHILAVEAEKDANCTNPSLWSHNAQNTYVTVDNETGFPEHGAMMAFQIPLGEIVSISGKHIHNHGNNKSTHQSVQDDGSTSMKRRFVFPVLKLVCRSFTVLRFHVQTGDPYPEHVLPKSNCPWLPNIDSARAACARVVQRLIYFVVASREDECYYMQLAIANSTPVAPSSMNDVSTVSDETQELETSISRYAQPKSYPIRLFSRVYDIQAEFARQCVSPHFWRLSSLNKQYNLCESYPPLWLVPRAITDEQLHKCAMFRSRQRLPVVSWHHPANGAVIMRSAQPLVGLRRKSCPEDQALLEAARLASPYPKKWLIILDARPLLNARANTAMGKGAERTGPGTGYPHCHLLHMGIANIHAMRKSLHDTFKTIIRRTEQNIVRAKPSNDGSSRSLKHSTTRLRRKSSRSTSRSWMRKAKSKFKLQSQYERMTSNKKDDHNKSERQEHHMSSGSPSILDVSSHNVDLEEDNQFFISHKRTGARDKKRKFPRKSAGIRSQNKSFDKDSILSNTDSNDSSLTDSESDDFLSDEDNYAGSISGSDVSDINLPQSAMYTHDGNFTSPILDASNCIQAQNQSDHDDISLRLAQQTLDGHKQTSPHRSIQYSMQHQRRTSVFGLRHQHPSSEAPPSPKILNVLSTLNESEKSLRHRNSGKTPPPPPPRTLFTTQPPSTPTDQTHDTVTMRTRAKSVALPTSMSQTSTKNGLKTEAALMAHRHAFDSTSITGQNLKIEQAHDGIVLGNSVNDAYKIPTFAEACANTIWSTTQASLGRLEEDLFIRTRFADPDWQMMIADSNWHKHLSLIIQSSIKVAKLVDEHGVSVLLHCSDGWDRTSQISALAQLMLDPYYRTIEGFPVLIEKDWLSFGHKFRTRSGRNQQRKTEESPVFWQFLDCVYQIMQQFPTRFEFNEAYLRAVAAHMYSGWFDTFLFDTPRERHELRSNACHVHNDTHKTDMPMNMATNNLVGSTPKHTVEETTNPAAGQISQTSIVEQDSSHSPSVSRPHTPLHDHTCKKNQHATGQDIKCDTEHRDLRHNTELGTERDTKLVTEHGTKQRNTKLDTEHDTTIKHLKAVRQDTTSKEQVLPAMPEINTTVDQSTCMNPYEDDVDALNISHSPTTSIQCPLPCLWKTLQAHSSWFLNYKYQKPPDASCNPVKVTNARFACITNNTHVSEQQSVPKRTERARTLSRTPSAYRSLLPEPSIMIDPYDRTHVMRRAWIRSLVLQPDGCIRYMQWWRSFYFHMNMRVQQTLSREAQWARPAVAYVPDEICEWIIPQMNPLDNDLCHVGIYNDGTGNNVSSVSSRVSTPKQNSNHKESFSLYTPHDAQSFSHTISITKSSNLRMNALRFNEDNACSSQYTDHSNYSQTDLFVSTNNSETVQRTNSTGIDSIEGFFRSSHSTPKATQEEVVARMNKHQSKRSGIWQRTLRKFRKH